MYQHFWWPTAASDFGPPNMIISHIHRSHPMPNLNIPDEHHVTGN